jgi:hypothetical protein
MVFSSSPFESSFLPLFDSAMKFYIRMADDDIFSLLQLLIDPQAQLLICVQEQCGFALSSKPS